MRRGGWLALWVSVLAGALLAGRGVTALIVNRAWYASLNAEPIFWERVIDTLVLRGGLWLAGTLFLLLNLHAVRRTILAVAVPVRLGNLELTAMLPARRLFGFIVILAALLGLLLTVPFDDVSSIALVRHGLPFNEMEEYFQRDFSFHVYWLPVEETLYVWSLLAIVLALAVVLILYVLTRSLRLDGRRIIASTHVRRHVSVLGALVLLLLAWSYRLDAYDLLRYGSGLPDGTFLRVDHVVTLKIDLALGILCLLASVVFLRSGWMGHIRTALATLSVVLIAALVVRHGLPTLLARGPTLGDQSRREQDYIATRALFTRRAYDVDGITVTSSDTTPQTTNPLRIADLPRVLSVWDTGPLVRALTPANGVRTTLVPVSWMPVGGTLQGVLLQKPTPDDGDWTLVSIRGAFADDRGAPVHEGPEATGPLDSASMILADDVSAGLIAEPLIAPGAKGHRLVLDSATRIVGARLQGWSSRVAHAWATRDPRLMSDENASGAPTLVMWRDVRERVRRLAPIFVQGADVAPLVHDGTLYWTVDLYSATDMYPLSQRMMLAGDIRTYFRHAATALVDSRTGRVRLVTVSHPDPIARTWMALAPSLFVPVSKLSSTLAELLPPPTDGAVAQVRAFARYGSRLDGPITRHFPDSILSGEPPPAILLEGASPAVGWTIPLLDGPEQLAGLAIASGGVDRGTRWMPVAKPGARWNVMAARLRNALDSSRAVLADGARREPTVTRGRIRVVLVDGSPVLMQPLYVTRLNSTQALARVAITAGTSVAVGTTTADAVRRLQGGRGNGIATTGPTPLTPAAREAALGHLYEVMRAALKRGDWTKFGQAFDSVGLLLGRPPL